MRNAPAPGTLFQSHSHRAVHTDGETERQRKKKKKKRRIAPIKKLIFIIATNEPSAS